MVQMTGAVESQDMPQVVCIHCGNPGYRTTRSRKNRKGVSMPIMVVIHPQLTYRDSSGMSRRKECYIGTLES